MTTEEIQLYTNWDDVICPICLDFPHNSVLLQCSSYDKGCRPFVCDTDHLHSNCLDRFKEANSMLSGSLSRSSAEKMRFLDSEPNGKPTCPLCRGEGTGWIEYGDDNSGVDFDNFHRRQGNWWTSCMFYQAFKKFRTRNRRRSRASDSRRENSHLRYDFLNSDEGSVSSIEYADYNADFPDEFDGEFARGLPRGRAGDRSSQRRRFRFYD